MTTSTTAPLQLGRGPLSAAAPTGTAPAPRAAAASEGAAPQPAPPAAGARGPDDAAWASTFGSPHLPPDCFAAAVDGERLWVGGDFTYAFAGTANDTYRRVAAWDGSGWQPMGQGVDAAVRAVLVVGTDVYVGGDFTSAGGQRAAHLARWDGTAWSAVAGGVTDPERSYGTTVTALASDGATLWVGGTFTRAGDVPVRSLAALDLATGTWRDAGGGVSSSWSSEPASVAALAVLRGQLVVGGSFDRAGEVEVGALALLDPATGAWSAGPALSDEGMGGRVRALAVDEQTGTAYVGGSFTSAGDVAAWNLVAVRDGVPSSLGDVTSYGGKYAEVLALAVSGGALYLGGSFTTVGGATAAHLARWDGRSWSAVGEDLDNTVKALAPTPEGGVLVLGDFGASAALRLVHGGIWTGEGWRTLGQGVCADPFGGGTVSAVVATGHGAYVGGLFDQAGQLPVGSVAHWDGTRWDAMAGGLTAPYGHGQVFAMAELGGDLYVAGDFATAGGTVVNNIARWDGATWHPLAEGLDDPAHSLVVLGGRLYAGGTFNVAGRVQAGHLACWDPATQAWSAVGNSPTYDHDIRALAAIGDRWLVVGGTFHRFFAGGTTVVEGLWGMALFDTAAELDASPVSGYHLLEGVSRYGAPGWVHALQVVGGDLYVGGWFDVAGRMDLGDAPSPGFPSAHLAVWHFAGDGSWQPVAGGTDHQVQGLADWGGRLAVGGWYSRAGSTAAARVAVHDPADGSWAALGSGLSDGARGASWALCVAAAPDGALWVGGEFPVAGGAPSDNLARWTGTGHP